MSESRMLAILTIIILLVVIVGQTVLIHWQIRAHS
jgi:hypothetical protein